ncbi:envoplakin-like [Acipenser oxyrinchus oxyrinchus]|uniref:Envoplakin-like n=1 Tax=Acipenser oxyrinchus oxyrinchus TaxID=40147 RepID=A0AAD8D2G3_ACIOX|nr:envoplakin-like [Acipenser oxyrinchus oxyrinchus]
MFRKKEATIKAPPKISKSEVNDLALLIARMQKNADQVEKDILSSEEKLTVDRSNRRKGKAFEYQKVNADNLSDAEGLLKDLFLDVDKAKKRQHPQATEIDKDVKLLHERWSKACVQYREVYDHLDVPDRGSGIDWPQILNQKQRQVNGGVYGPTLPELEKQIAEHNILHKEVEQYGPQIENSKTSNPEQYANIQEQYKNLLDNSQWRGHYLGSLYDYMQGCTKELTYLNEQQEQVLKRDWSDRMAEPADVRRQYENFKTNSLMTHESEVNKLQDDGDRLIEMKHPASPTIQAHRDAVRNEWQSFLNLCICQESHLQNVEDYKKFQDDVDTVSQSVQKLNTQLDPKSLGLKSNSEILRTIESQDKSILQNERLLADLKKRSPLISPLKLRRSRTSKPVSVESLCDWDNGKAEVTRGEKFILKDNTDNENWVVQASNGVTKSLPGVCFNIPPPDPEAIDKLDRLNNDMNELKRNRADLQSSLKRQSMEVNRSQKAGGVYSSNDEPQARKFSERLDLINGDLVQTEKDIVNRLRAPLNRSSAPQDMSTRLQDQERTNKALQSIGMEKDVAQREIEAFISTKPTGPTAAALPNKLNNVKSKYDEVSALSSLYTQKANAALNLEKDIKLADGIISKFERELAADTGIVNNPSAIQARNRELQKMQSDLSEKDDVLTKLGKDLDVTQQQCNSLQKGFQEYCPDIKKQEAEVQRLRERYASVAGQIGQREQLTQEASRKNQSLQNSCQSLNNFMDNLPNNKISTSDGLSQVTNKYNSQKRVVEDIKRKGDDMDRTVDLSQDLQMLLNDYDTVSDKYRSSLDPTIGAQDAKRLRTTPLQDSIQKQEKDLVSHYTQVSAENEQLLNQLDYASKVMGKKEQQVNQVVIQQQLQQSSQLKSINETESLKTDLENEISRRTRVENELAETRKRLTILKGRRGVERVEEKEVVQYYRDPKLESDLFTLRSKIEDENMRRSSIQTEIDVTSKKITVLEKEMKTIKPQLLTKEVTQIEPDPQLDRDAAKLREEIRRLKEELRTLESETVHMRTEITILEQQKPKVRERMVMKEVVKLEKDPEMLMACRTFEKQISDESQRSKSLNDHIFQTRSQINTLERIIPTVEPKIITKEVKKVEQDPMLIKESARLRTALEEERNSTSNLLKEFTNLQLRFTQVDVMKQKVEIKEIVKEIFQVDPETERELVRLRRELQDSTKQREQLEVDINKVMVDLNALRSQPPKVEIKEVNQEVVKLEKSPETLREIERMKQQLERQNSSYNSSYELLLRMRKERDEWKVEKSKVETKLVTKEVTRYENDPLLEKEADRLRRELRDEGQHRRATEEKVFDLQNTYILLERQKPQEKVVVQEVTRLQKDPRQAMEHEKLCRSLDEEVKTRRKLELEVQQLRALVEEKERILNQQDERSKKIQVEMELRQIKTRITEINSAPPPVEEKIIMEEVLKVERDPHLEKASSSLRGELEKEMNDILRLEREFRNIQIKVEVLTREKSMEKTVYKEVIRVEKDRLVEGERTRIRDQLNQERNARRDAEDELQRLSDRLNRLENTRSSISREEAMLIQTKDALRRDKEAVEKDLKMLDMEKQHMSISYQQHSKLMSERSQVSREKSIKMETEMLRLEQDILQEKDKLRQRELTLRELLEKLKNEEKQNEMHMYESNLSTKISIFDPDTGKDMSSYEAYKRGLIDYSQYIILQEQECDWEEITTRSSGGQMLLDKKSGKQYSIDEALRQNRVTPEQVRRFREGKLHIAEFALLVAGETKPKPIAPLLSSTTHLQNFSYQSGTVSSSQQEDSFPIAGIYDPSTDSMMSVRSAVTRKLIDPITGQKLLEMQAATGGIIDISTRDRYSIHKAAERSLIDNTQLQRLLNAQKAFTGVEDPVTKNRLSVGEAVLKGWMPRDNAMRYMEAQYLTGGLIDPKRAGRINLQDAVSSKMIDGTTARELQEDVNYAKDLIDPVTKEKINYKEAMARCHTDEHTGLLLLPASSNSQSYATYRPVNKPSNSLYSSLHY